MDIRQPIGSMFSILGVILVICGFIQKAEDLKKSLDWNMNLYWGLVMIAFGVMMLMLARRSAAKKYAPSSAYASGGQWRRLTSLRHFFFVQTGRLDGTQRGRRQSGAASGHGWLDGAWRWRAG
jgi:hypothetical protein